MKLTKNQIELWNNNGLFIKFYNKTVEESLELLEEIFTLNPTMGKRPQNSINPVLREDNILLICKFGYGNKMYNPKGDEGGFKFIDYNPRQSKEDFSLNFYDFIIT